MGSNDAFECRKFMIFYARKLSNLKEFLVENKEVIIKGLDIPFLDLVVFLVKLALASLPAIFILSVVMWAIGALFGAVVFPPVL